MLHDNLALSVILVSHNVNKLLRQCLTSLFTSCKSVNLQAIVVDNCSQDGSGDMVADVFPDVMLIRNESNVGFAAAANQGIRISCGKYILLLNPDTLIVNNAIDMMLQWMENYPDVGICGPQLLNPDATIQRSIISFPSLLTITMVHLFPFLKSINRSLGIGEFQDHTTSQLVECVSGACFMIRQDVINSIGTFDERFFLNAEEMDFCRRATLNNWKVYFLAEAKVIHYGGQSSKTNPASGFIEFHRAQHIYYTKYFCRAKQSVLKLIFFSGLLLRTAYQGFKVLLNKTDTEEDSRKKWTLFCKTLRWYLSSER